jgi:hypothetical protein
MNILLDYFFPITSIEPTPEASTAFLKQVLVVVKPKSMVSTGSITLCTSKSAVAALTDNTESDKLFDAGLNRVHVLPMDDLDLAAALEGHESDFFTILISSDFSDEDVGTGSTIGAVKASLKIQDITFTAKNAGTGGNSITINYNSGATAGSEVVGVSGSAITITMQDGVSTAQDIVDAIEDSVSASALVDVSPDAGDETDPQAVFGSAVPLSGGTDEVTTGADFGEYNGVVGVSSDDDTFLATQAAIGNRAAFHTTSSNKAKNMFYAFGKMLSNAFSWRNQQYIEMPLADDVDTLGDALNLFDDKISFVISDSQYLNRLALFAAGGKAIVAPYIKKNLEIDFQSAALSYISGNQPAYTKKNAALLEDELKKVIQQYKDNQLIEAGTVSVTLEADNFVASAAINISEPNALWRIEAEMRQTL